MELSKRFFIGLDEEGQYDVLATVLDRLAEERPLLALIFLWVEYEDRPLAWVARRVGASRSAISRANKRAAELLFQMVEDELDARGVLCVGSGTRGKS